MHKSLVRLAAPLLVLSLGATACGTGSNDLSLSAPPQLALVEPDSSTEILPPPTPLPAQTVVCEADSTAPIKVGHLTYHTGDFGEFGEFFDEATSFTLDIINEDPPMGRRLILINEDIGTVGEAEAATKLLEQDQVDILLNPAHSYGDYRDFMLSYQRDNNAPLMPSVHGGAIERVIGGETAEPLFRGSPMDTALGSAAVYQAQQDGASSIVIVAAETEGHQLQKEAALQAAGLLDMDVVTIVDVESGKSDYSDDIDLLSSYSPDGVIMFTPPAEGGLLVRNAIEAGRPFTIVGTNEWQEPSFIEQATLDAVTRHDSVSFIGFDNAESPAWDFMEPLWNESGLTRFAEADNSYTMQYYDLLVASALAIEAACSVGSSEWAEAMPEVTSGGTPVFTYAQGVDAIRRGIDIDYSGVTGEFEYTATGVVSARFAVLAWTSADAFEVIETLDDVTVAEIDANTYRN